MKQAPSSFSCHSQTTGFVFVFFSCGRPGVVDGYPCPLGCFEEVRESYRPCTKIEHPGTHALVRSKKSMDFREGRTLEFSTYRR